MMNNKQEPKKGLTGSIRQMRDVRGKPKIGRHKRGRISLIDGLIVNRLTSDILLE